MCQILLPFLCLHLLHVCLCDWASDWMIPIQDEFQDETNQNGNSNLRLFEDEELRMLSALSDQEYAEVGTTEHTYRRRYDAIPRKQISSGALKVKLESTLAKAQALAAALKKSILETDAKEKVLKEAIVNGRLGVTTARVKTLELATRSYVIRDGSWTLCDGVLREPASSAPSSIFQGVLATPRCIGQMIPVKRDLCAYNSVIKYEVIPESRGREYHEEDHLCLKGDFETSMQQYLSVPKRVLADTCRNGVTRPLEDLNQDCGVRTLTEYTFFPNRDQASTLPLEYCIEAGGACKLVVAWHVSNATLENFEFLSSEPSFQKYFLDLTSDGERF